MNSNSFEPLVRDKKFPSFSWEQIKSWGQRQHLVPTNHHPKAHNQGEKGKTYAVLGEIGALPAKVGDVIIWE